MLKVKPLSLRQNFSWTFIGNVVYSACQWGMVVLLAKIGSPEMVGQFTLGFAITAPIFMFTNLQLRTVQATDTNEQYLFADYLSLRIIMAILGLFAVTIISLLAGYRNETLLLILLLGLAKVIESVSDIFYGLFQKHERMDRIGISLLIKGPLSFMLLGIGVYIFGSLTWGLTGLICGYGLVLFGWDFRNRDRVLIVRDEPEINWDFRKLRRLLRLSFPLGFVMMLISLNTNIPRYFIERNLGTKELGIFAAMAYLMVVGNMLVSALAESAISPMAKCYANRDKAGFCRLLLKLGGVGLFVGGMGIIIPLLVGEELLTFIYSSEYAKHIDVFLLLMVAGAINYTFALLGYGRTAARYFSVQVPLSFIVTTSSALVCFWLVPHYGLRGAAFAIIVAAIVEAVNNFGVILHALYKIDSLNKQEYR